MFNRKPPTVTEALMGQATATADAVVEGGQHVSEMASQLAHNSMEAVRDTSRKLGRSAQHAADQTVAYIQKDPVKALMLTVIAVAGLTAIAKLLGRSNRLR